MTARTGTCTECRQVHKLVARGGRAVLADHNTLQDNRHGRVSLGSKPMTPKKCKGSGRPPASADSAN